jgi:hypothetical protein
MSPAEATELPNQSEDVLALRVKSGNVGTYTPPGNT